MDNLILGIYLGHLTLMIGLYLLSNEILNQKIAEYCKWAAISSLVFGGALLMILCFHKM